MYNPHHSVQACVIGAGVVGLATARALAMIGKEVLLLERASTFGSGTSSRNSEVIHAGIYYPSGSLKAKLCVKGKQMLYNYCQDPEHERHVEIQKVGKLIVATNELQMKDDLPRIAKHASGNGVHDLRLLTGDDVRSCFEPEVTCHGALYSPSSGIVDSHAFMLSLLADAEEHGATVAFNSPVEDIQIGDGSSSGSSAIKIIESGGMKIACDIIVNCAGLHADKIARSLRYNSADVDHSNSNGTTNTNTNIYSIYNRSGQDNALPRQFFAKGNYYRLQGKNPFQHLVYPVPAKGGLGIHATIDLSNNCRFGPDVEWVQMEIEDPDEIDMAVDKNRATKFYNEIRKYWPYLKDGSLCSDYSGIRPKLGHPDFQSGPSVNSDFIIEKTKVKGIVNLLGIESPGLTASMAIAEEVLEALREDGSL